jgi:hypothetical protein
MKRSTLALGVVLVSLCALSAAAQETRGWFLQADAGGTARTSVAVANPCREPHYYRIRTEAEYVQIEADADAFLIDGAEGKLPLFVDATRLQPGTYRSLAVLECIDCRKTTACPRGAVRVPVETTILPAIPGTKERIAISTRFSAPLSTQSASEVGIIPETSGGCPPGSQHIYLSLDDEDHNNASYVSGWTGNISHYSTGTTFGFCRVDGSQFHSHVSRDYAVLKLGSTCPSGSMEFFRVFDDEHNANNNWSSGSISPSSMGPPARLYFCFFPAGVGPTMSTFPNFYVHYGTFAAPWGGWFASGTVFTDDEDTNNHDYTYWDPSIISPYPSRFAQIIYGTDNVFTTRNTFLLTAKVANDTCNVNPCPYIGSYDGANCWVGQPPAGTGAFIYANNFYYTPVAGNLCPRPGSWFDGANCFVTAIPPQTQPFIWSNMWYVAPVCRP